LVRAGEVFFYISCAGHEGMAVVNRHLLPDDWLHLHYRDTALVLARGMPLETYLDGILANALSPSAGRQMGPMLNARDLRILSMPTLVGNHALQAVGIASVIKDQPGRAITVCSLGDGATQQGEVLEAIAEAVRSALPVLFLIEDNGYSISTRTQE